MLFDTLTVTEHINMVCELKNIPRADKNALIEETLSIVMLTEH